MSYWDAPDSPPGGGVERPTDNDWKSPFDDPSNLFGELGWGTTWFSDRWLWEWQQVYELSFEASACSGTPDDWIVTVEPDTGSSPSKPQNEICGLDANQATLTVIKDSIPDDPWDKYDFLVSGPTPAGFTLQDPGVNECPEDPLCSGPQGTGAWTRADRVASTSLIASPDLGGAAYRVRELAPRPGYTVGWECKNAAVPLTATCDPARAAFDFDACSPVAASCAATGSDWADGHISCRQTDDDFATCAAAPGQRADRRLRALPGHAGDLPIHQPGQRRRRRGLPRDRERGRRSARARRRRLRGELRRRRGTVELSGREATRSSSRASSPSPTSRDGRAPSITSSSRCR